MFDPLVVVAILFLYIGILFLIASLVERDTRWGKRLSGNPMIYILALAVYCTSWTFYGSVGSAATSGWLFLTIYLGPTLMITLWWFVLRKLVRIKSTYHITSIADFVSARYGKSQLVAALVTIMALIGTSPYIALQLKSVSSTFTLLTSQSGGVGTWIGSNLGPIVVALMALFTIIMGVRRLDPTERHAGVMVTLALGSVIKVLAFLAVGLFVTYGIYDGFGDIFSRLADGPFHGLMYTAGSDLSAYLIWMSYLVLSMSAILFLPRQFHVAVVENTDEEHIRKAQWSFPLYLLLINIFVFPVAVGGLLQGLPAEVADTFVLTLPMNQGRIWLAIFVFIGGFAAATGMIIVSTMTMATMLTNHLVLPLAEQMGGLGSLRRNLLRVRWVAVAAILLMGYLFERALGESYTLVNMGIISFAAVLQFAPAILGGLFWQKGNRTGALAGLSAGFLVWAYTLFVPSLAKSGWLSTGFIENGPFGITFLKPEQLFGLSGVPAIPHTVLWSLLFNIGFYVLGSLYAKAREDEKEQAEAFVGILVPGAQVQPLILGRATIYLDDKRAIMENLLGPYFTSDETAGIIDRSLIALGLEGQRQISVGDLANLQSELERILAGALGTATAHQVMTRAELYTPQEAGELSGVYSEILADLRVSPEELRQRIDYYQERDELLARQAADLGETVAERTRDLEAAAEVGRVASTILDPDQLIQQTVDMIRDRFDLYFVGLLLVDENREWAVLRAGTGEAGRAMLARGYQLKIGEGMVGWSIVNAQGRVASDVDEDAVHLDAPELPATRSEAALPLRSRGQVLGALTVQSTRPDAFDQNTVVVLQIVADQVAVALDNARLFIQSQAALDAERRAYGDISREAWSRLVLARAERGYLADHRGILPSLGELPSEIKPIVNQGQVALVDDGAGSTAYVPIPVRNQIVGVLNFSKASEGGTWSREEISLLEEIADQVGQALESARLYRDTQRRAAQDRLLGEVTARVRETLDVDTVLQTAVREMGDALGIAEVEVRLGSGAGQTPLTAMVYDGDDGRDGAKGDASNSAKEVSL